jgi:hypothetical protein
MASISEPVRYFVLPIMIGFIGAILSAFVEYVKAKSEMAKTNRDMQIAKAIEICRDVIAMLDSMHAHFNYDVWHIAWRRALPPPKEDEEREASDKEKWNEYEKSLHEWRSHELQYETEIQGSFGEHGYEALLFAGSSRVINECSTTLREIYYFQDYYETMTAEAKNNNRIEFDEMLKDMRGKIKILSAVMIHCVQKGFVGTLRGENVPNDIPEEWHKEAGTTKWQAEQMSAKAMPKPEATLQPEV